jgi:CRP/FNR family transcriptional regulator
MVKVLSFHEVGQRLALLLLAAAQKARVDENGSVVFKLDFSNHEIAIRMGSVRDVVSRALARFQQEGLIVLKRRQVVIPNVRFLKRYAEGSQ